MDERRSSQYYPTTPYRHIAVFVLALFGFTILLLGLTGCGRSPELIKKQIKFKDDCIAACSPRAMNEFGSSFTGQCRCD